MLILLIVGIYLESVSVKSFLGALGRQTYRYDDIISDFPYKIKRKQAKVIRKVS
jgi:hypothetical protein